MSELTTEQLAGLVETFLAGRPENTRLAYSWDLEIFRRFAGAETTAEAAGQLLAGGRGVACALALRYRAHLLEKKFAPKTINRRLTTLRNLVKLAGRLELAAFLLDVELVPTEEYRDTAGPGAEVVRTILSHLADAKPPRWERDRAIVRLLFDLGLRRGEVASLDLEHLNLTAGTLTIMGKGKRKRQALTLPAPTREALAAWVAVRGNRSGPLFIGWWGCSVRRNRNRAWRRLDGRGIHHLIGRLGKAVGAVCKPHGLRHSAITTALEIFGGDVRKVARFSRHSQVQTVLRYDDNRADLAGDVARRLAEGG